MTDDINRLREALKGKYTLENNLARHKAAQTLLTLYETHTPEAVRSLIEGKAEIGPISTKLVLVKTKPMSAVYGRPVQLICENDEIPLWPAPDGNYEYFVRNATAGGGEG